MTHYLTQVACHHCMCGGRGLMTHSAWGFTLYRAIIFVLFSRHRSPEWSITGSWLVWVQASAQWWCSRLSDCLSGYSLSLLPPLPSLFCLSVCLSVCLTLIATTFPLPFLSVCLSVCLSLALTQQAVHGNVLSSKFWWTVSGVSANSFGRVANMLMMHWKCASRRSWQCIRNVSVMCWQFTNR